MQETDIWSLGQEDPLEKGMANPLQCSCLENSMDKGAWQAIVYGVTKSPTWLNNEHFHFHAFVIACLFSNFLTLFEVNFLYIV